MKRFPIILLFAISAFALMSPLGSKSSGLEEDHVPRVVARFDHHLRAVDLPTTIELFSPEQAGLFRVNFYAVATNYDPAGLFVGDFSFGWTDDASAKIQEVGGDTGPLLRYGVLRLSPQVGSYASTSFVVRAIASSPITFSAANVYNSGFSTSNNEFTVFFTIERL